MGRSFYTRGWHHSKSRGREQTVPCGFCGRMVPKYKTFSVVKGFAINDPLIKQEVSFMGRSSLNLMTNRVRACPACARHRSIVRKKR